MKILFNLLTATAGQFLYPICPLCHDKAHKMGFCQHCWAYLAKLKTPDNCCLSCSRVLATAGICGVCQQQKHAIELLWAAYDYTMPLDSLILRWKNHQQLSLSTALSHLFLAHPPPWLARIKFDGVLAVPLSDKRLLQRGFNQSMELARQVSSQHQIAMIDSQFIVRSHRPPQTSLKRKERLKNIKNSFQIKLVTVPRRILLIDDVVTTTTTLNELAKSLKSKGVREVYAWVLSRKQS